MTDLEALKWANAEIDRLRRIERLAGELTESLIKDCFEPSTCEDIDCLKARELKAEIEKGA
jgi:hypothetical protein